MIFMYVFQFARKTHPALQPFVVPILIICCIVIVITWLKINKNVNDENKKNNYLINHSGKSKEEALKENKMLFKMLKDNGPSKVSSYFFQKFDLEVEPTYYHIKSYLENTKKIINQKSK
ncbi:hypothetical protein [Aquimarina sp. MMG016]|uniref:hypothetical protein n=1 Tax=Aquimarina sp. MMG016 TaxID=2822690 RepID=UPI001B3A30FC|nr:hypothetical protein [Aquimarina sp. MMG016]MBQ4818596.1 hypothetical protein [Aquimarina sp. MMG016]